ncbi:MAG TPA: helix-turn-helix domain-containing protein, partial [Candidatus Marinimicrobia bacterium]|nr:helix-turn-helix domain-containing protein [Candidatus Neomarinimicrobiota bacterium]
MKKAQRTVNLNADELDICQKISADEQNLHQKRAIALLALDDGKSRSEAASISGLSPGQVKYLSAKFLKNRIAILSSSGSIKKKADPERTDDDLSTENPPELSGV